MLMNKPVCVEDSRCGKHGPSVGSYYVSRKDIIEIGVSFYMSRYRALFFHRWASLQTKTCLHGLISSTTALLIDRGLATCRDQV
jgi:hypothetical protein